MTPHRIRFSVILYIIKYKQDAALAIGVAADIFVLPDSNCEFPDFYEVIWLFSIIDMKFFFLPTKSVCYSWTTSSVILRLLFNRMYEQHWVKAQLLVSLFLVVSVAVAFSSWFSAHLFFITLVSPALLSVSPYPVSWVLSSFSPPDPHRLVSSVWI